MPSFGHMGRSSWKSLAKSTRTGRCTGESCVCSAVGVHAWVGRRDSAPLTQHSQIFSPLAIKATAGGFSVCWRCGMARRWADACRRQFPFSWATLTPTETLSVRALLPAKHRPAVCAKTFCSHVVLLLSTSANAFLYAPGQASFTLRRDPECPT